MTELELDVLATRSEAIELLKDGYPLDEDIIRRLVELGIDYEAIQKEFSYEQ